MNVYIVWRDGEGPEGAFETSKLAEQHVKERYEEGSGHPVNDPFVITKLEVVRSTDWISENNSDAIRAMGQG